MVDRRSCQDRRVSKDRRKVCISSYDGPENRSARQQRNTMDRRERNTNASMNRSFLPAGEGRRTGIDQRQFSYAGILPERRSGKDRRGGAKLNV